MKFSNAFPNSSFKPIEIVENVGENAYRLSVLPYMHIYLVLNVENMKHEGFWPLCQEGGCGLD